MISGAFYIYDGCWLSPLDVEEDATDEKIIEAAWHAAYEGDYGGISWCLEIREIDFADPEAESRIIGTVIAPGRKYVCPACNHTFAHPAKRQAVCRCGHVCDESDLEKID